MYPPDELPTLIIDKQEFPAVIERQEDNPDHFTLYYGGIIIPNGPCRGRIVVEDGIITRWELPNTVELLPHNGESIEPYVTGPWRGPLGDWPLD